MENIEGGRSRGALAFKVDAALFARCAKSRFAGRTFQKEVAQHAQLLRRYEEQKRPRVGGSRIAPSHFHIVSFYSEHLTTVPIGCLFKIAQF